MSRRAVSIVKKCYYEKDLITLAVHVKRCIIRGKGNVFNPASNSLLLLM